MRTIMLVVALAGLLAGCGGGGSDEAAPAVTIAWEQPAYTSTAAMRSVPARVVLGGSGLPPILSIDVQPSAAGIVIGTPPFVMNGSKQVPVTLTPEIGASGYVRGTWTVTATASVNGVSYRSTTTFVSQ